MIEIFIFVGALIFLLTILYMLRKKKKREKNWLLFEKKEGLEDNPKISYFAVNKSSGIRRPVILKR